MEEKPWARERGLVEGSGTRRTTQSQTGTRERPRNLESARKRVFTSTLGENWETFLQAKGSEIDTMDTALLYAEVRTSKLSRSGTQTTVPPQPPEAKALSTQFQGNRRGRGGGNSGYQRGRGRGRGRGGIG